MSIDLSNLQLKDLTYILAIARTNSFRRAADLCGVTQATISVQVAKIEKMLNLKLIERKNRGITFTPESKPILSQIQFIVDQYKHLAQLAINHHSTVESPNVELSIGVIPTLAPFFLGRVFPNFNLKFPGYNFKVQELTTEQIIHELEFGNIQIGIVANHQLVDDKQKVFIGTDDLVMIVNKKHEPSLDNLSDDLKIFILNDGNCLRDQVIDVCTATQSQLANLEVDFRYAANSIETLKSLASSDLGASIIPATSITSGIPDNITMLGIDGNPQRSLYFIESDKFKLDNQFKETLYAQIKAKFEEEYQQLDIANIIAKSLRT